MIGNAFFKVLSEKNAYQMTCNNNKHINNNISVIIPKTIQWKSH